MVMRNVLLILVLAGVVLVPVVGYGADANTVNELFAQAEEHERVGDNLRLEAIYKEIAASDVGGDDGLMAQEKLILHYLRDARPTRARGAYEYLMANFSENEKLDDSFQRELLSGFRDRGDYTTSLKMYEHMKRPAGDDKLGVGIYSGTIQCYIGLGNETKAKAEIDKMLADYGNDESVGSIISELAYVYRSHKRWGRSRELYEQFVANWPNHERAILAQRYSVKASIKLGDYTAAEAGINKLIADYGDNEGIGSELSELAGDYAQMDDYAKAVELYGDVVNRWSGSAGAVIAQKSLARMWIAEGDYEKADALLPNLDFFYPDAKSCNQHRPLKPKPLSQYQL